MTGERERVGSRRQTGGQIDEIRVGKAGGDEVSTAKGKKIRQRHRGQIGKIESTRREDYEVFTPKERKGNRTTPSSFSFTTRLETS